jgi:branched-chain amino acid transport system ATP-binding protein
MTAPPLLEVEGLATRYGQSQVLFGMDLAVGAGEAATLLGRNGMGKTTTIRSILGLTLPFAGRVVFDGQDMTGRPAHAVARAGIGLVPEGRQIFPTLTVEENLVATAADRHARTGRWTLARVFALFPRLEERRRQPGSRLSGGEQQMLAIGRALMTNPKLLILDEATEGLAPLIRKEIWAVLGRLRAEGQSILVIDKNLAALERLADRHTVIAKGKPVWTGDATAFRAERETVAGWLGV